MKTIAPLAGRLALAAVLSAALTACQAGSNASTSQDYAPVDGRNVNLPADASFADPYLAIRGAQVVDLGTTHSMVVTVVNQTEGSDVLESVSIADQPAMLSSGPVEVAAGQAVSLGAGGVATATVEGLDLEPGDWVDVSLSFSESGVADLQVLTVPATEVEPLQ